MKLLNRSALMLLPLPPYVKWINSLPAEISELEQPLPAGALDNEGRVYLTAEFEPDASVESVLADHWQVLLENELGGWDELGLHWPEPLTQALLQQWFTIRPLALAFDAVKEPLLTAEL
jgi:hypothetical protein